MVASCGAKFFKYCLFAFNLLFFIAGVICLGVGIWLAVDEGAGLTLGGIATKLGKTGGNYEALEHQSVLIRYSGIILSVGGAIIILVAFLGCCGAIQEWRPLLVCYAICLLVIIAIELGAAIYVAVNPSLDEKLIKGVKDHLVKYYNATRSTKDKKSWDSFMIENKCCGAESTQNDFRLTEWKKRNPDRNFPVACCGKNEADGSVTTCNQNEKFQKGCYLVMKEAFAARRGIIIGVGVTVGLFQIFGVIFSLCLCQAISEE